MVNKPGDTPGTFQGITGKYWKLHVEINKARLQMQGVKQNKRRLKITIK
jgi:hypothetical protein